MLTTFLKIGIVGEFIKSGVEKMKKTKSIGVIVGRFQPFHNGHAHLIKEAFRYVDDLVIFIGSANRHPSIKNPFSANDRKKVITQWFESEKTKDSFFDNKTLLIEFSNDFLYKEWRWKAEIQERLDVLIKKLNLTHNGIFSDDNVFLIGHSKDASSYYLNNFPEWHYQEVENFESIDATNIRKTYFESGVVSQYTIPEASANLLKLFKKTSGYNDLVEEYKFYVNEQVLFKEYPFPETLKFSCTDAVVTCFGHVLLIQRKHAPGKNTWALPGGFVNRKETFNNACIRELKEETNLRVPEKVLRGSIRGKYMFDEPGRTIGIPRVSMAFHIEVQLGNDGSFPEIRPSSDACNAKWVRLSDIENISLFEDHKDIIDYFV